MYWYIAVYHSLNAVLPSLIEDDPIDVMKNIYTDRSYAYLKACLGAGIEIFSGHPRQRCTINDQSPIYGIAVLRISLDPQVEIFGRTWFSVNRNSISTNNKILSFLGVQGE